MTANNVDRDLAERVRRLEERLADVQRYRAVVQPNMRDLRDSNLTKASNGQVPEYNELTGRWDPVPGLATKAALAGATFTGGVSVQGATTDAASGVRRVSLGASAAQTPRLILENPDFGGTRWALINTNSELQVWEFTSGTSKMAVNTLGDMTLVGNLPVRGPTKRGGVTQNELDAKQGTIPHIGARRSSINNQTITAGVQTQVVLELPEVFGDITATIANDDVVINVAGHYRVRASMNFSFNNGAGGTTLAGSRETYIQVFRANAIEYEQFRSVEVIAAKRATYEMTMFEFFNVGDTIRAFVIVTGSNVRMEPRPLPNGNPTTMTLDVLYDHAA